MSERWIPDNYVLVHSDKMGEGYEPVPVEVVEVGRAESGHAGEIRVKAYKLKRYVKPVHVGGLEVQQR